MFSNQRNQQHTDINDVSKPNYTIGLRLYKSKHMNIL